MNEWSSILDPLSPFRPRDLPITHITMWPQGTPAVADLEAHRAALCREVVRLEDALADERREVARLRAVLAGRPRKAPIWWIPLAWIGIAWTGYTASYAYELKEEADHGQATDRD